MRTRRGHGWLAMAVLAGVEGSCRSALETVAEPARAGDALYLAWVEAGANQASEVHVATWPAAGG